MMEMEGVKVVIEDIFHIGWVEFLHGKIPKLMTRMQGDYIASYRNEQGLLGRAG